MKRLFCISLLAVLLGSTWSVAAQKVTENENGLMFENEYRLDLSSVKTLYFEDMGGSMEFSRSESDRLVIEQVIPVGNRSRSEAVDWGLEFELETSISGANALVKGSEHPRSAMYEIRIPAGVDVDLETDWGDIEASHLRGNMTIRHGGGTIEVEHLEGTLVIRSDGGAMEIEDVTGSVTINSDGGAVDVVRIGDSVTIATGGGSIDVENVTGDVSASTAGGNVDIINVSGNLRAVTSAGNLEVMDIDGDVVLSNGGGSIEVSGVGGMLTATTSGGDIEADDIRGTIRVETLAGDVELANVRNSLRVISEVGDVEIEVTNAVFLTDGGIEIDLGHGDIELMLPQTTDARLVANIQDSGGIDISNQGWAVDVIRTRRPSEGNTSRRSEIQIGRGGGDIQIRLISGEITIDNE